MFAVKIFSRQVPFGLSRCSSRTLTTGVLSWGDGKNGKLGHGNNHDDQLSPGKIDFFDSVEVAQVSCGTEHSAAVTLHGEIYTWGNGVELSLGTRR